MKMLGFSLTLICILFMTQCASVPPDSRFLIDSLSNEEKSRVVCDKGILMYKSQLEKEENFQVLPEIKEYFEVALRFDPENEKAEEYLVKLENFVVSKVEEKIGIAEKLLAVKKPTEKQNFQLAYAVKTAYDLDPKNEEVLGLKKKVDTLTDELIDSYLKQTQAELTKIVEKDTPGEKAKKYISAMTNCRKALQLRRDSKKALSEKRNIESFLELIIKDVLKTAKESLAKKDYKKTESALIICNDINKNLDGNYTKDIAALSYDLYYVWAQAFYGKKDYNNALAKLTAAIRAKNTKEAIALKKKITNLKYGSDFAVSFKKWMAEIDSLITKNKYVEAYDKIQSLLGKTRDKNYVKQLKNKEKILKDKLQGLYNEGIKLYKQEKFKNAIELLKIIVHIDENYEQVKDYLDKA
ncbi:MAG: hypothetical protein OQK82_09075, partial [Candidatus Pacearchaeota archaeon]|nr:hypothetical protein [Candidatus Pacearchaeota archaeon]